MDTLPTRVPQTLPAPAVAGNTPICPQCHQPVLPTYYFCPNCGKKLEDAPLPTTLWAEIWLYTFTLIIMPLTCYLVYSRWQGIKYYKSRDPKAHRMGLIAIILLISTIVFLVWSTWASLAWFDSYVQTQENSVLNQSGLGS